MAELKIKCFDGEGDPSRELPEVAIARHETGLYTADLKDTPFPSAFRAEGPGEILCTPSKEPFFLHVFWGVPGFGEVILCADHGGEGFTSGGSIHLNYELARTHLRLLEERRDNFLRDGYCFSDEVISRIRGAGEAFERAGKTLEDGERAHHSDESLCQSLWAGETLELERARQGIEQRKTEVTIKVVDVNGNRVPNARITCKLTNPAFWFGAFESGSESEAFRRRFEELFNFITVAKFYWERFEPEEKNYTWSDPDRPLDEWLCSTNIKAKGHPVTWFTFHTPRWIQEKGKDFEALKTAMYEHVYDIVRRYKGKIDVWDVTNEAHDWNNILGLTHEQMVEIHKVTCEAARKANPDALLTINVNMPWGNYIARRHTSAGPTDRRMISPLQFIQMLEDAGLDYDVIGIQLYYPIRDLAEISRQIDRYARFGKPIHITELGTHSEYSSDYIRSSAMWHGRWTEELQADWVEQFYTLCFGKPEIKAIVWLAFAADVGYPGLIHKDMTPKKAFYRLRALLDRWRTEVCEVADTDGVLCFKGHRGSYSVRVDGPDGGAMETEVRVTEEKEQEVTVVYPYHPCCTPRMTVQRAHRTFEL